jgi:hypothetical protein
MISEITKEERNITIHGNTGQIAIGNNIVQEINHNCVINKISPSERPIWERGDKLAVKPRKPKNFINRTSEIQQIEEQVKAGEIINLNGPIGIGKSALIEYIAHLVKLENFPDGIYHLSALDLKLGDLLHNIFSAFFNSNVAAIPNRAQIQNQLREIEALILIDDLSLSKDEIKVVLNIAPQCIFVFVSSQVEPLSGIESLLLKGLPESESQILFEETLGRSLDKEEKNLTYEICRLLEGHPETIIQTAAKVRMDELSLPETLSELTNNSSEKLIEEELQNLPETEQKILSFLAVLGGRFLPQEHINGLIPSEAKSIQNALDQLVDRALIQPGEDAYRIKSDIDKLVSQTFDLSSSEDDLIRYFADWSAERQVSQIPENIFSTLKAIIRKAFDGQRWSEGIKIGRTVETAFFVRGYWQAWEDVLKTTLEGSRALGDPNTEAWALHQLGSRSFCLDLKDQARQLLKQAASIRKEIGDVAGLNATQHNLSLIPKVPVPTVEPSTALQSLSTVWIGLGSILALGLATFLGVFFYRPAPPALNQPIDKHVEIPSEVETRELNFDWQSVILAETYQFQFDDQENFSSPEFDNVDPSNSMSLEVIFEQGIYFWRVRGISRFDKTGKWSETWQIIISERPPTPSLTFPEDDTIIVGDTLPDLSWSGVIGGKKYEVQVDDDADFSSSEIKDIIDDAELVSSESIIIPVTGDNITSSLEQGEYYWRVRAINEFDTPGDWSAPWKFTVSIPPAVPELSDPQVDERIDDTRTPVLEWESAENGTTYQVWVDNNQDFSSPEFDTTTSNTNSKVGNNLTLGEYYWQVRAFNEYGTEGAWSETRKFIVNYPPESPNLISPVGGILVDTTQRPGLDWGDVEYATDYTVEVDNNRDFSSPEFTTTTSETNSTVNTTLAQGEYYWRAQAINQYGTPSEWSDTETFTISVPPGVPELIAPKAGDLIEDTITPVLDWQSAVNATTYQVRVDNNQNFSSPEFDTTTSRTDSKVGINLTLGEYYWQVRAFNEYGTDGDWSPIRKFIISIKPEKPVLSSPSDNQFIDSTQAPTFSWSSVPNADRYELQVSNNSSFSPTNYNNQSISGTSRKINVSLSQGEYYWKVRAINEYGTEGDWSSVRKFTISIAPIAPSLIGPVQGFDWYWTQNSTTFWWSFTSNMEYFRIQIAHDGNFNSIKINTLVNSSSKVYNRSQLDPGGTCTKNYTYYWRVRAYNTYDTPGPWSDIRSFVYKRACVD